MKEVIKTKKELLSEAQKERRLAELFNQCMQIMNECYRKTHQQENPKCLNLA